jgi:hypothetical protein
LGSYQQLPFSTNGQKEISIHLFHQIRNDQSSYSPPKRLRVGPGSALSKIQRPRRILFLFYKKQINMISKKHIIKIFIALCLGAYTLPGYGQNYITDAEIAPGKILRS